jgi:hypothetical protein
MDNICAVFLCNKAYFNNFITSCKQLITTGNYNGQICLVIGDDLKDSELLDCELIKNNNIIVKYFPNIIFPREFLDINNKLTQTDGRNINKKFQWHKMYLFDKYFKKWDFILYLDCGISIFSDITPILNERTENTLVAHSDSYPMYVWKLHSQFENNNPIFNKLNNQFNLNNDYFQTTMLFYDTNIIQEDTFNNLIELMIKYPISRTNEQGIIALYFTIIKPCFKQLKINNENTYFYDFMSRNRNNQYIMLKRG